MGVYHTNNLLLHALVDKHNSSQNLRYLPQLATPTSQLPHFVVKSILVKVLSYS